MAVAAFGVTIAYAPGPVCAAPNDAPRLPRTIDFSVMTARAIMMNCNSFYQSVLQHGMLCYSAGLAYV
jgi:hypothetical protein